MVYIHKTVRVYPDPFSSETFFTAVDLLVWIILLTNWLYSVTVESRTQFMLVLTVVNGEESEATFVFRKIIVSAVLSIRPSVPTEASLG